MTTEELVAHCMKRAQAELEKTGEDCNNTDAAKRAREWLQRAIQVRTTTDVANAPQADAATSGPTLPFEREEQP